MSWCLLSDLHGTEIQILALSHLPLVCRGCSLDNLQVLWMIIIIFLIINKIHIIIPPAFDLSHMWLLEYSSSVLLVFQITGKDHSVACIFPI